MTILILEVLPQEGNKSLKRIDSLRHVSMLSFLSSLSD